MTQYLNDPATDIIARFSDAPRSGGSFPYEGDASRTRLDLAAGLDVLSTRGINVRLSVAAQWDDQSVSIAGFAGLTYAF